MIWDLFGFGAMGLISGLGGGIIRDILLQHGPPDHGHVLPQRPVTRPDGHPVADQAAVEVHRWIAHGISL
jgi:Glycine transporter